jgi:hypothetical protein
MDVTFTHASIGHGLSKVLYIHQASVRLMFNVPVSEEEGRLHCLSGDESRRAYEASHLG